MKMIRDWHIVVTRCRHEKKCEQLLTLNGIESYLPIQRVLRQWSDRKKWVESPLFPGYLFVKYDASERYKVLSTDSIARVVQFEKKDYVVDENIINGLQQQLNNHQQVELVAPDCSFEIGDEVVIVKGPFIGTKGKLAKINGKTKIVVLIEAINQGFLLELKENEVEKI